MKTDEVSVNATNSVASIVFTSSSPTGSVTSLMQENKKNGNQ